jgi:DNA-binding transcriptional ArsR family regulator
MTKQAIDLMFGLYRRTILAFLFSRPTEDFHVRELERELEIPVGSLQRELKALSAAGLLRQQRVGNQVRYRVDPAHPLYEDMAAIFRKTLGIAGTGFESRVVAEPKLFVMGTSDDLEELTGYPATARA